MSSSTPTATAKPISAKDTTGSVPSTAKVLARISPAEVITPPVAESPARAPRLVPRTSDSSRTRLIRKML